MSARMPVLKTVWALVKRTPNSPCREYGWMLKALSKDIRTEIFTLEISPHNVDINYEGTVIWQRATLAGTADTCDGRTWLWTEHYNSTGLLIRCRRESQLQDAAATQIRLTKHPPSSAVGPLKLVPEYSPTTPVKQRLGGSSDLKLKRVWPRHTEHKTVSENKVFLSPKKT